MFYIYAYLDPRKPGKYPYQDISFLYEPIYIGKGKHYRIVNHLYNNSSTNIYLKRKIAKIKSCGLTPIHFKISVHTIESDALKQEALFIKQIGKICTNTGPLVNFTDGGEGTTGYKHTTISLQKISNNSKLYKPSIEMRKQISQKLINHSVSAATRAKISKAQLGKKHAPDRILRHKLKIIGQKRTAKTKQKMSISHKNITNWKSNLYHYILIDPAGNKYDCYRNLKGILKQHNLVYHSIIKTLKTKIPVQIGKCKGWICEKII